MLFRSHQFYKDQYKTLNKQIIPELEAEDIHLLKINDLTEEEYKYLDKYYEENIYPVLTPLAVDAGRPFPLIPNQNLNLFVTFKKRDDVSGFMESSAFAIVEVPSNLPRLIKLPSKEKRFLLIENVIAEFLERLFYNQTIESTACFRVMRNADYELDEEEISDLMLEMEDILWQRERGNVIRLEIERKVGKGILKTLQKLMNVEDLAVFRIKGPIDLNFVDGIKNLFPNSNLRYQKFNGQISPAFAKANDRNYFSIIRQQDIILHHPFG